MWVDLNDRNRSGQAIPACSSWQFINKQLKQLFLLRVGQQINPIVIFYHGEELIARHAIATHPHPYADDYLNLSQTQINILNRLSYYLYYLLYEIYQNSKYYLQSSILPFMSTLKPEVCMIDFKKKFANIVYKLEDDFKSNTMAYKEKFYQLSACIARLYKETKKCHATITAEKYDSSKLQQASEMQIENDCSNKLNDCELDPFIVIEYFRQFCESVTLFCISLKQKQRVIKKQMNELFVIGTNSNFLETLAKKNLQNYDLCLKLEQLQTSLKLKASQCKLIEKTTAEYQKKFKQFEKDYNSIVVSIANILKQSQMTEIQLKQQNRLQKELIQSHKIQFQRFKQDFKLKPSQTDKINKIKHMLDKKYQEREAILIKQTQKIVEKRIKNKSNEKYQ